jgi:hypothetical protein
VSRPPQTPARVRCVQTGIAGVAMGWREVLRGKWSGAVYMGLCDAEGRGRTAEITTHTLPDGRPFLAYAECVNNPAARELAARFSNYWRFDVNRQGYVGGDE